MHRTQNFAAKLAARRPARKGQSRYALIATKARSWVCGRSAARCSEVVACRRGRLHQRVDSNPMAVATRQG